MTKKKVEPTFGSIFRAVEEKASKVSFLQMIDQIRKENLILMYIKMIDL